MASQPLLDARDAPLFGETSRRDRILNVVVGGIACFLVLETLVSAFLFPHFKPHAINVVIAICILLVCITHIVLVYWYREGELEPKFLKLIYYNTFAIVMLCIASNLAIHKIAD